VQKTVDNAYRAWFGLCFVFVGTEDGDDAGSKEHADEDDGDDCIVHGGVLFSVTWLGRLVDIDRIARVGRVDHSPLGSMDERAGEVGVRLLCQLPVKRGGTLEPWQASMG